MKRLLLIPLVLFLLSCEDEQEQIEPKYSNLAWAANVYDWTWNQELEKEEYKAHCFFVDTSNQCGQLRPFLNDYVVDTIKYHHWREIRLLHNQDQTVELIGWTGLVTKYSGIEYYQYIYIED